jgi:hypothetical protein
LRYDREKSAQNPLFIYSETNAHAGEEQLSTAILQKARCYVPPVILYLNDLVFGNLVDLIQKVRGRINLVDLIQKVRGRNPTGRADSGSG